MSEEFINYFLLAFIRCFGLFVILPLPNQISSVPLRGAGSFVFALIETLDASTAVALTGKFAAAEFFLGAMIAFPTRLLITAVEAWSELLDSGRGQTLGSLYNPMSGAPSSQSAQLFSAYVWAALVCAGFLPMLFSSLLQSFDQIAIGTLAAVSAKDQAYHVLLSICLVLQSAIIRYIPIAALFFAVDVLVGFCSKTLNNSHFYSENFQIKTYLSILFLMLLLTTDLPSSLMLAAEPRLQFLFPILE